MRPPLEPIAGGSDLGRSARLFGRSSLHDNWHYSPMPLPFGLMAMERVNPPDASTIFVERLM